MSKPQWKLDLEAKERAVQEREEAEKRAKAQKLASLGYASGAVDSAPVHISEAQDEEVLSVEQKRIQRHMDASDTKAAHKSEEQVAKEKTIADEKAAEQARSDAIAAKMARKMAEFQATKSKSAAPSGGLTITTEEEEYDEEAKKRQAVMNISKFISK